MVSCGREKAESEKRQSSSQEEGQRRTGFQPRSKLCGGRKGEREHLAWGGRGITETPHGRGGLSPGRQEMARGGESATEGRREDIHGEAGQGVV